MKPLFSTCSKALLLIMAALWQNMAAAQDSATLVVTGELTPGSCDVALSNSGNIDYGTIYGTAQYDTSNQLGVKNIIMTIACDIPLAVAIVAIDNKKDSIVGLSVEGSFVAGGADGTAIHHFGLGTTVGGKPIGDFTLGIDMPNAVVDGLTDSEIDWLFKANITASSPDWDASGSGAIWEQTSDGAMHGMTPGLTSVPKTPLAFTNATIPLIVSAAMTTYASLETKEDVALNGSVTISLVYL